ncbi:MAG: 3-oxoacyl-[acyl-carrier-protein] synthase III C-terminal domain-containing protein [Planctomycetota bacterium]
MTPVQTIIESVGTYLPPRVVTTREVLDGCREPIRVPLERLTGIKSRHFAGEDEFAIDLATESIQDCLKHSRIKASDFGLIISANISRWDGDGCVGYEPSTAVTLKDRLGFTNALAFDISNACASLWTAAFIADAFIQSGAVRHAMVFSGEYISHLTANAQREIESYLDPQLASLTLGDSGVAVAMSASNRTGVGFEGFDMYTLGKYSRLCVAKPSDQPHGGAVMHTDAVKVTASIVPHAAAHAEHVLQATGRHVEDLQHIIPHQTSRMTIQGALDEIAKRLNSDCRHQMIDNLQERGNTASTTHFLAMRDCIDNGRIRTGDKILFAISGSGQTTGTAVYTCDDMPDRLRGGEENRQSIPSEVKLHGEAMLTPFTLDHISLATPAEGTRADSMTLMKEAASSCLNRSDLSRDEIEMLISVGVYRTDFLTEPALAAMLAGDLGINADAAADNPVKTFGFDLLNGSIGFLNACHLLIEMGRAGRIECGLIVASEVENNLDLPDTPTIGLCEMASAAILRESTDGESGFHAFRFDSYPTELDDYRVTAHWNHPSGRTCIQPKISPDLAERCLPWIRQSVNAFLSEQGLSLDDIDWLLPPQMGKGYPHQVATELGMPSDRTVDICDDSLDRFTSSTPAAMMHLMDGPTASNGSAGQVAKTGDKGLIINVGSGFQVACALYQF